MTDFDYDVMQKKNIARGAQHKKNGSKSRKCGLPHENMTRKALEAINGECKSYKLNQPMSWAAFKELPDDLKAEYLRKLRVRFHVHGAALSKMFGINQTSCQHALRDAGIVLNRADRMTPGDEKAWELWLNGETCEDSEEPETEQMLILDTSRVETEATIPSPDTGTRLHTLFHKDELVETAPVAEKRPSVLHNGKLYFEGSTSDVTDEIVRFLSAHPGNCRIALKFEFDA